MNYCETSANQCNSEEYPDDFEVFSTSEKSLDDKDIVTSEENKDNSFDNETFETRINDLKNLIIKNKPKKPKPSKIFSKKQKETLPQLAKSRKPKEIDSNFEIKKCLSNYSESGNDNDSPSTTISFRNIKTFNIRNPRPTLCEKPILYKSINRPEITALSWVIINGNDGQTLTGKHINKRREIASLTKIMTCYVVIQLIEKMKICPKTTFLQISKKACSYKGTSAELEEGDIVSIWDLLHGLMLPSGNDAAYSLAENFGVFLFYETSEGKQIRESKTIIKTKKFVNFFIDEMNERAKQLKLTNTSFANVHGLSNNNNKSTAYELAKISYFAMQNQTIKTIVKSNTHYAMIKNTSGGIRQIEWINTNKLIEENNYIGLKTGNTNSAGSCLSAVYKEDFLNLIIVVLGSLSIDHRFEDVKRLVKWLKEKININFTCT